jgi:RNA polymerase sigma factor (sigma-70 family)
MQNSTSLKFLANSTLFVDFQGLTCHEIAVLAQSGDSKARLCLIQKLSQSQANHLKHRLHQSAERFIDDLPSIIAQVVEKKLRAFDKQKADFSAYIAPYLKRAISRHLQDTASITRLPKNSARDYRKICESREQFRLTGIEPTPSELARSVRMQTKRVFRLLALFERSSTNVQFSQDMATATFGDTIADPVSLLPSDCCERRELHDQLNDLLKTLPKRPREIIRATFLAEKPRTPSQLAKRYGISDRNVRLIIQKALVQLRTMLEAAA